MYYVFLIYIRWSPLDPRTNQDRSLALALAPHITSIRPTIGHRSIQRHIATKELADSMMPPPELMDELVEEILVRFPPGDPASLVRAALVCKPWCRLVSGAAFRRRFREFHHLHRAGGGAAAAPPLLGVLYNSTTKQQQVREDDDTDDDQGRISKRARILREPTTACFVPTTSFRPGPTAHAANSRRCYYGWRAIDARHGRVLLRRSDRSPYGHGLSVWDPVTDEQQQVPKPKFSKTMLGYHWTAAVACAATDDCDHLDCHRGPFLVVVMDVQSYVIYRCVYSSQAAAWSDLDVLKRPEPVRSLGRPTQADARCPRRQHTLLLGSLQGRGGGVRLGHTGSIYD
jgi:hypothetical protein